MERKLASIQKVISVEPIENSDNLECIKILGWQVVAKKGDFKEGQLCVYCEVDSILPDKPEFEFLRAKNFRIKTIKLRGTLSQGIAFPLEILGEDNKLSILEEYHISGNSYILGQNVTEMIGVTKYEPKVSSQLMGSARGLFPTHIVPKTDEQRIQSAPKLLEEMKGHEVYITQKEDGTSFTAYYSKDGFGVCSRNLELKPGDDVYWKISKKYNVEEKLRNYYNRYGDYIAIQGEIVGEGIQKNPLNIKGLELHLFNIFDTDKVTYLHLGDFVRTSKELEIPTVQILEIIEDFDMTLEDLLNKAKGNYPGTNNPREGIVVRPTFETYSETLRGRMSFKVINNDYLLKEK